MDSTSNDLVCIGVIAGAQGLKGLVKVKAFTATLEDFLTYGDLLDKDGSPLPLITPKHFSKGLIIAAVDGITTRTQAESLKNTQLFITRDQLPKVSDDTFYHADLIGLSVLDLNNNEIGKVLAIHNFGAGDMIEFLDHTDNTSKMILFRKEFVPTINIQDGQIVIDPSAAV